MYNMAEISQCFFLYTKNRKTILLSITADWSQKKPENKNLLQIYSKLKWSCFYNSPCT